MLILAYLAEGVVRGWSDTGIKQQLAWVEIGLSALFFAATVSYARLTRSAA